MAAFNIISGVINTETIKNAGATVTTDTTLTDWADLATHTVQVKVSATGAVTYLYDGAEPTTVVAYSFDDAEVVVPFVYFLHNTDIGETTGITNWNCRLD